MVIGRIHVKYLILIATAAATLMSGAAMAQTVMAGSPHDMTAATSTTVKGGGETLVTTYPGYIWTAATVSPTYHWGPAVAPVSTPTHTMPAPPPAH